MPIDSVPAFVEALRQNRLLEPEHLAVVEREQKRTNDARILAKALIQKGWLTPFQVNQVLQNKGADLQLGQYRILERLGEGGMGQVFKARHAAMGRIVALKVIRKERLASNEAVKRFHREIRAAAALHHPNIVMSFDADQNGATHYLAMEYVEGVDLSQLTRKEGPRSVEETCEYIRQAAVGLQYAHERGMVHRDIKPANLLLERPAETNGKAGDGSMSSVHLKRTAKPLVKILDMGLARLQPHEQDDGGTALSVDGSVMGTPDFMAPEQAKNSHQVDHRADIYSLGCTMFFLLTKQAPFPGGTHLEKLLKHQMDAPPPLANFRQDVPDGVQQILDHMLAKKPEDRFASCAEVAAALEPYCTPGATPPPLMSFGSGFRAGLPSALSTGAAGTALMTAPAGVAVATPTSLDAETISQVGRPLRRTPVYQKPAVIAGLALLLFGGAIGLVMAVMSSSSRPESTGAGVAVATPKEPNPKPTESVKPTEPVRSTEPVKPPPLWGEFTLHRMVPENTSMAIVLNPTELLRSHHIQKLSDRFKPVTLIDMLRISLLGEFGLEASDINRVVLAVSNSGPDPDYVLLQGKIDPDKVRNAMKRREAVAHQIDGRGRFERDYYAVSEKGQLKYYVCMVRPGTLVITKDKANIFNVVERSGLFKKGDRGDLKDKDMQRMLDNLDNRPQAQIFISGAYTAKQGGGSLADASALTGIRCMSGSLTIVDGNVEARVFLTCLDGDRARGLKDIVTGFLTEMAKNKDLEPFIKPLQESSFSLSRDDKATVIVERRFGRQEVDRLIDKIPLP